MLDMIPGCRYSRSDIRKLVGLPADAKGGNWYTGVVEHGNQFFTFANVGHPGQTGHDYPNRWEDGLLHWYHLGHSHLGWPKVQQLLADGSIVHVLWRNAPRKAFIYAGTARPFKVIAASPVEVLWSLDARDRPDEIPVGKLREGAVKKVKVNAYERDPVARQICIDHYGLTCAVCELRFDQRYGPIGAGFIHVHHLVPLSQIGAEYQVDPISDLRPVCPNCHAMIHRRRPPFSIKEVRESLRNQRGTSVATSADSS